MGRQTKRQLRQAGGERREVGEGQAVKQKEANRSGGPGNGEGPGQFHPDHFEEEKVIPPPGLFSPLWRRWPEGCPRAPARRGVEVEGEASERPSNKGGGQRKKPRRAKSCRRAGWAIPLARLLSSCSSFLKGTQLAPGSRSGGRGGGGGGTGGASEVVVSVCSDSLYFLFVLFFLFHGQPSESALSLLSLRFAKQRQQKNQHCQPKKKKERKKNEN